MAHKEIVVEVRREGVVVGVVLRPVVGKKWVCFEGVVWEMGAVDGGRVFIEVGPVPVLGPVVCDTKVGRLGLAASMVALVGGVPNVRPVHFNDFGRSG